VTLVLILDFISQLPFVIEAETRFHRWKKTEAKRSTML